MATATLRHSFSQMTLHLLFNSNTPLLLPILPSPLTHRALSLTLVMRIELQQLSWRSNSIASWVLEAAVVLKIEYAPRVLPHKRRKAVSLIGSCELRNVRRGWYRSCSPSTLLQVLRVPIPMHYAGPHEWWYLIQP